MASKGQQIAERLARESEACVLATASNDGKPEAATIEFVADAQYDCVFESFPHYRKYANLSSNPKASIVITREENTLQMDGLVKELSGADATTARNALIAKYGKAQFYDDPNIKFFKFTPSWIRVLVEAQWPPRYEQLKG